MQSQKICVKAVLKLITASLALGLSGGIVGALFSLLIGLVTNIRTNNGWLICLLPLFSVTIVFLYQKLKIASVGTNQVLKAADEGEELSPLLSLGVFITAGVSHLFGASVGREGAALQIGGSLAAVFAKLFRFDSTMYKILVRAGMAAVFAAVFGTPLAAFFFALEVVLVGSIHIKSVIPCFVSSYTGYFTARLIGAHPERFNLLSVPQFSLNVAWKIAVITVLTAVLSIGFCHSLSFSAKYLKQLIKNPFLRIIIGGAVIVLLTVLVGNQDYNGAGINVIENIFNSSLNPNSLSFKPEAFALKLIFTCISVAAGFKGGEIVPTLFIGSTFGALVATLLGLSAPFGAALGMILLFCGVTNCPLASLFLSVELFSGVGAWYFVPTIALCFLLSGKISLYSAQKHRFNFL